MRNPINKKKMNRLLAFVLTAMVILSMSSTAFAQENAAQVSSGIIPYDDIILGE